MQKYDLIVIGSGPAGEKAAVKAAYFGYKVAVIEKESLYGGTGVVNGTLPSKTLKETALYLSGKYDKGLYGTDRLTVQKAGIETFMYRKNFIIRTESEEVHKNLMQHQVDIYHGTAAFKDAHTLHITGEKEVYLSAENIIIATGSYPFHPNNIPFDNKRVLDSDTILNIDHIPPSIAILGAGVIGCEYATIFNTMGSKVFLINRAPDILNFIDQEITQAFIEQMQKDGIDLLFGKNVQSIETPENDKETLKIKLDSEEILHVDMFLFAAGRCGNTRSLKLENVGIKTTNRETIEVNESYQTSVPNIYAVGDVTGFPALASASMDQGRVAVTHIFNTKDIEKLAHTLPYGIYTIPEISCAGLTEKEVTDKNIPYATGVAYYKDMPRGKILGAQSGLLKLIFNRESLVILGVHIMGHIATELIHHGLSLIESQATVLDVIGKVYNFPTLHDLYKYAAYDGLSNISGHKVKK
jgi:NAD(P) transhydrogenase